SIRGGRTADRSLVTKLAARLIYQEFGLVGTADVAGNSATVRFKGAALNPTFDRLAKKGDVFAIVRVEGQPGAERAVRITDVLVQLTDTPKGGVAPARVERRVLKTAPLANPGQGFRCIKLGAAAAPVRLRLVDERGLPHNQPLQVYLYPHFDQREGTPDE